MAATVTYKNTLDINFHIVDGTAVGNNTTWKFNDPSNDIASLSAVRDAFGGTSGFLSEWFKTGNFDTGMSICNKNGDPIDNVDGARKVAVVTTKEDLG